MLGFRRDTAAIRVRLTQSQGSPKIFEGTEPSSSCPCTVVHKPPIGKFEFSNIKIPRTTKFSGQQESIRPRHVRLLASSVNLALTTALHLLGQGIIYLN